MKNLKLRRADAIASHGRSEKNKLGIKLVDQLFMFLVLLKNGLNLDFTIWLSNSNKSTVSPMLISWINHIFFSLGAIPIKYTNQCQRVFKTDILIQDFNWTRTQNNLVRKGTLNHLA